GGMLATGHPFVGFEPLDWWIFVGLALGPQIVGHNAISWALRYVRADTIAVLLLTEPIRAALLAWLLLGESLTLSLAMGGLVLLAGVGLVIREERSIAVRRMTAPQ